MDLAAFNDYEKDFLTLTNQLPSRVNALLQYNSEADAANAEIRKIEADLTSAKQRLTDMQVEARGLSDPTRKELGNKINMYRASLDTVSGDLTKAKTKYQRNALLGGGAQGGAGGRPMEFDKSLDQRQRMMNNTDKLRGGNDTLQSAHSRLEETIEVAEGITGELQRNRETLTRIRGNVGIVSGSLDQARRILRSMSRREVRTKLAVGVFAVCMLAIIGGMIYYVSNKNKTD